MLDHFIDYLKSFNTKFVIAGYNVGFDKKFVSAMFTKHDKSSEFFNLFSLDIHCTYKRAQAVKSQFNTPNLKLETLAKAHNIHINAHDALSDIEATIKLDKIVGHMLGEDVAAVQQAVDTSASRTFLEPAQLHLHSMYGMVDSIPSIDQWEEWCKKTNTPGFSMVDHGTAISMYHMTKVKDVVGIPGCGLYFMPDDYIQSDIQYMAVNAWAVTNEGYFNLMKLASICHHNKVTTAHGIDVPILKEEDILKYRAGIKFGTACYESGMGQKIASGDFEGAEQLLQTYMRIFGDLYVEFNPVSIGYKFTPKIGFQPNTRNDVVKDGDIQKALNRFLARMSDKYALKCIPVSGAMFIEEDDKIIQDCISKNSYKSGKYYRESYHAKTAATMFSELKLHLGKWLTEDKFDAWIKNTHDIMGEAKNIKIELDYHLPKIDIPEHIKSKVDDYDTQTYYYMMERIKEHGRWSNDPVYVERFKKELDVIMKNDTLNFIPYFLVYEDLGSFARRRGILQNIARGSAGGSLLSYYLKIIHVDPIKADLPFERFLSHARIRAGSFPDIDMDIGDTARSYVMAYLKEKYGLGFAQISTFSTMKTKNALKDIMYALYGKNRNDPEIKAVCDTIPDSPQGVDEMKFLYGHTDKEGVYHKGQMDTNEHLKNFFKRYPEVEMICKKMIGLIRGWSRHASAFVISTVDMAHSRVPTTVMHDKDAGDILVTQYDASMVERCGLVKADILGIKTLTAVSDCIDLVRENTSKDYLDEDGGLALIYRLPEDEGVYADFYNKDTDSSFQFNTELIKGYIQEFVPTERKHLSAMTALCRPGALDAEWEPGVSAAQFYMDVRNNKRQMTFIHEDLRPFLSDSNGVFVYQEEVMKFLVEIAGYTLEDSDQIRNAIAKKKHEVMMKAFDKIREGTSQRGWSSEQTEKACNHIMAFSRYSFNKSHSHAYAELGYITMYLKHHHPLEWWTSVLNGVIGDEFKLRRYMAHLGDLIAPPSLKKPSDRFQIVGSKIVAPVSIIKGIGPSVVNELTTKGPFEDLADYITKVNHSRVNIGAISALIKGRAADSMMDKNLPYAEARRKFMDDYISIRKARSSFNEELNNLDPISIFLQERDINKCFNKHLLSDDSIKDILLEKWPGLQSTGREGIPFMMGNKPVLGNLKVAEGMVKREHKDEVGMILLYEGCNIRKGVSKKSGKEWCLTSIKLSDGYGTIEAAKWDQDKPFRWPKNTIVYVRGELKTGWKTPVSITISEIEKVER
jgi:DNA polymerase-3 subunit alpha